MKKKILILTSDPLSINYEIIKKSIFFFNKQNKNDYIFVGCKKDFIKNTKLNKTNLNFINIEKSSSIKSYLKNCFEVSFNLLQNKKAHGLINLPLNKKFLPKKYPGFTEYIADYFNLKNQETMLLYNQNFSVSPNTTHLLLKHVSKKLNFETINKNILNINFFFKKIIGIKTPRLGLMGLNPHNGIDFKNTTEENKILIPALKYNQKRGIKILGLLSPDFAFLTMKEKKINCLVGNYHDQVLPIFKFINKFKAINITLGLPFLRISPDHGTAIDIKGKNKANPESFLYALNFFEKYFNKI